MVGKYLIMYFVERIGCLVRRKMFPMMKYFLFLLLFVLNVAAFAADSCITIAQNVPSKWDSVAHEWIAVNGEMVELRVFKNVHDSDYNGIPVVTFIKRDVKEGSDIVIDSIVYPNGAYIVEESNWILNVIRHRDIDGVLQYTIFEGHDIANMYDIGQKKENLYGPDGKLNPMYTEVRGDTAFRNLDYRAPGCGFGLIFDGD